MDAAGRELGDAGGPLLVATAASAAALPAGLLAATGLPARAPRWNQLS